MAKSGLSRTPDVCAKVCQKGVAFDAARFEKARPMIPDMGAVRIPWLTWLTNPVQMLRHIVSCIAKKVRSSEVSPKVWLVTSNPANWTLSLPRIPATGPEPYVIWRGVPRFTKLEDASMRDRKGYCSMCRDVQLKTYKMG